MLICYIYSLATDQFYNMVVTLTKGRQLSGLLIHTYMSTYYNNEK